MTDVATSASTRVWSRTEILKTVLALGLFLVSLYDILVSDLDDAVIRGVFLGFALFYAFAFYAGG